MDEVLCLFPVDQAVALLNQSRTIIVVYGNKEFFLRLLVVSLFHKGQSQSVVAFQNLGIAISVAP